MLEFVDSGLYFVQDKNSLINSLLQVGSGSSEKSTGSGSSSLDLNILGGPDDRPKLNIEFDIRPDTWSNIRSNIISNIGPAGY